LGDATKVSPISLLSGWQSADWVILRQTLLMDKTTFLVGGWRESLGIEATLSSAEEQSDSRVMEN
jgi:hypothetical protein